MSTSRPFVPFDPSMVLFPYGPLQQPAVQDTVLGRRPDGWPDHVAGYRLDWITITDPEVVRVSGSDRHLALVADPDRAVSGTAWHLTGHDLAVTD